MAKSIIVLGAGMVGVGAALHLQARGFDVVLVDRKAPGRETSYGNAGIIQREVAEPLAFPHNPLDVMKYGLRIGPALSYHTLELPLFASSLYGYWKNSSPKPYAKISHEWESLIAHCLDEHAPLIKAAGAQDLVVKEGYNSVFESAANYEKALAHAKHLHAEYGIKTTVKTPEEFAKEEPLFKKKFVGVIHWDDPWTVKSPGDLVSKYAELFTKRGGKIVKGDAQTLAQRGEAWQVLTDDGIETAEHVLIALGPWSEDLITRFGYDFPLFVKRGYHQHFKMAQQIHHETQLGDHGVMLAPMKDGLRIATGIEFARRDDPKTPLQLEKAKAIAERLLGLGEPVEAEPWMGSRPATVDMKPVIGAAPKHKNMWFDFGHSHQGFTLGPATGRLIAEMINGETPYINPAPFSATRF